MESLTNLIYGFSVALTPENLFYAFIGCSVGMLVGVLPGIGQSAGMAILIPITYFLPPAGAIIMLASIFYGAMYGGSITSILLNIPGESEAIATTFDGHPMALQGRGGPALALSAIGSFIGGVLATLVLAVAAVPLSRLALNLGPPEYLALMLLGLSVVVGLIGDSVLMGLIMVVMGLLLAQVGADPVQGTARFTFGQAELLDGLPLLAIVMGFFGLSDVFIEVERRVRPVAVTKIKSLMPSRLEIKKSIMPSLRGTGIGVLLGFIPGMVVAVSTFASYVLEKRISKEPETFGKGAVEGVVGPETTNNAFANTSFVPLLTLGIPSSASLAILLGAFRIQGITPGPQMFREAPDVAWGLIASMVVGNAILVILSLPLVRLWVSVLRIPTGVLYALILAVTMVGMYTVRNSVFDLGLLVVFTMLAYVLKKIGFALAPAILAFVLGHRIEVSIRQSLTISQGDPMIFVTRPISVALLLLSVTVLVALSFRRQGKVAETPEAPVDGSEMENRTTRIEVDDEVDPGVKGRAKDGA